LYFDGAAQNNSGVGAMGRSKDPANVEEIPAEVNQSKERNNERSAFQTTPES
jgi:hypothetical protein